MGRLDEVDLSLTLSREEEAERAEGGLERLTQLRLTLGGLIGEPARAAGLRRLRGLGRLRQGRCDQAPGRPLDPRHVRVVQFAAPTPDEKRHHFLWRFWPALPGWGGMAVFDRSWYGRVLVERVEGFATREQWRRAYEEINSFERSLADEGTILVKFWLHISAEEQLKRFERRARRPAEDLEADRRGLAQPREAAAVHRGGRGHVRADRQPRAPWHVIPAESKRYARVEVMDR